MERKSKWQNHQIDVEASFLTYRTINWKDGKNLTTKTETKKQVPTDSFFNFFAPPNPSEEDEDSDNEDEIEARLELDYQMGEDIKGS